jgi:hypothetical protein
MPFALHCTAPLQLNLGKKPSYGLWAKPVPKEKGVLEPPECSFSFTPAALEALQVAGEVCS